MGCLEIHFWPHPWDHRRCFGYRWRDYWHCFARSRAGDRVSYWANIGYSFHHPTTTNLASFSTGLDFLILVVGSTNEMAALQIDAAISFFYLPYVLLKFQGITLTLYQRQEN